MRFQWSFYRMLNRIDAMAIGLENNRYWTPGEIEELRGCIQGLRVAEEENDVIVCYEKLGEIYEKALNKLPSCKSQDASGDGA